MKLADHDPEKLNTEHLFSHILNFGEMQMLYDCVFRNIFIFDLTGTTMVHLFKTPLTRMQKLQAVGDVSTKNKCTFRFLLYDLLTANLLIKNKWNASG